MISRQQTCYLRINKQDIRQGTVCYKLGHTHECLFQLSSFHQLAKEHPLTWFIIHLLTEESEINTVVGQKVTFTARWRHQSVINL